MSLLSKSDSVKAYAKQAQWPLQTYQDGEPEPLGGGLINFVWRVPTVTEKNERSSVILKAADHFLASAPSVPFSVDRQVFEARALLMLGCDGELFLPLRTQCPLVRTPSLIHHDSHAHVLVMEDLGPLPDLRHFLQHLAPAQVNTAAMIGGVLGEYIGLLHATSCLNVNTLLSSMDNKPAQQMLRESYYNVIAVNAKQVGFNEAECERIAEIIRLILQTEEAKSSPCAFLQGDLWLKSVLVDGTHEQPHIFLIDWEFSSLGPPASEVAHLAAHAFMAIQSAHINQQDSNPFDLFLNKFIDAYALVIENIPTARALFGPQLKADCTIAFALELINEVANHQWCGCGQDGQTCQRLLYVTTWCKSLLFHDEKQTVIISPFQRFELL